LTTRETVAIETPASSAISRIVGPTVALAHGRPLKHVPGIYGTTTGTTLQSNLDFARFSVVTTAGNVAGTTHRRSAFTASGQERNRTMGRDVRSNRRLAGVAAIAGLAALAALFATASAPAAHLGATSARPGTSASS